MFKSLYSFLQRRLIRIEDFGPGSIIKFPYKLWGRRKIRIGNNVFIAESSFLSVVEEWEGEKFNPSLEIGDNTTIGSNFFATCIRRIKIEENVLISDRVFISDHIHGYEDVKKPVLKQKLKFGGEVLLKSGSFIGINVVIMPGVTIGKNSVVGASSVVTKSVPDYTVVAGVPAKVIKKYYPKYRNWK